ncbi:MAG: hypothetical protein M3O70_27765 [Actinomycetota bacterium]|nr:hypothetical protein [Actinomycetota bacterium]
MTGITGKARKRFTFVAAVLAGLLTFSSVAFACIAQKGKLQVTGATTGDTVIGDGGDMSWCQEASTAARQTAGNNVTYTIGPASTANGDCATTSLTDDTDYEVRVYHPTQTQGYAYKLVSGVWEFQSGTGCYARPTPRGVRQGDVFALSSGAATVTRALDVGGATHTNGTDNAALVCVADSSSPSSGGIFSPLRVAST